MARMVKASSILVTSFCLIFTVTQNGKYQNVAHMHITHHTHALIHIHLKEVSQKSMCPNNAQSVAVYFILFHFFKIMNTIHYIDYMTCPVNYNL